MNDPHNGWSQTLFTFGFDEILAKFWIQMTMFYFMVDFDSYGASFVNSTEK